MTIECNIVKRILGEFPLWHSGLNIWHCCGCNSGSDPWAGNFLCLRVPPPQKKRPEGFSYLPVLSQYHPSPTLKAWSPTPQLARYQLARYQQSDFWNLVRIWGEEGWCVCARRPPVFRGRRASCYLWSPWKQCLPISLTVGSSVYFSFSFEGLPFWGS